MIFNKSNTLFTKLIIVLLLILPLYIDNVNAGHLLFPPPPPATKKPTPKPTSTPKHTTSPTPTPTTPHTTSTTTTPTTTPKTTPKPTTNPSESNNGGSINGDRPTWIERANHFLVNALRIDPQGYKKNYFKGGESLPNVLKENGIYKTVDPLYYRLDLDKAALSHTEDMASTPCFSHNNCNGTLVFDRIRSYLVGCNNPDQEYSSIGENIVKVHSDPLEANNFWICESAPVGPTCVDDGANDGHRANLLNSDFKSIGIAAVLGKKDVYTYWTQDFDSEVCPMDLSSPIHSGSHIIDSTAKTCLYGVTFYSDDMDNADNQITGSIYINGKSNPLQLQYGKPGKGVYYYSTNKYSRSDKYYYQFDVTNSNSKSNKSFRYPEKGSLVTIIDFKDSFNSKSWVDS